MDGVLAARRKAEVEVRQMDDAKPVQLRRQARESHVQRAEPNPAGLELAPGEGSRDCGSNQPFGVRQLDLELVEHRLDRDDVALELQLRLLEAGGDADQL